MPSGLSLRQSGVGKAILNSIQQGGITRVVEVGAQHHTYSLRMETVNQFSELVYRAIVFVYLCVIERIIAVIAIMREIIY
ncbi:unknown [Prevotella sp. CAG:485]|nr:unknown [Prevotella sp. CAG:485]